MHHPLSSPSSASASPSLPETPDTHRIAGGSRTSLNTPTRHRNSLEVQSLANLSHPMRPMHRFTSDDLALFTSVRSPAALEEPCSAPDTIGSKRAIPDVDRSVRIWLLMQDSKNKSGDSFLDSSARALGSSLDSSRTVCPSSLPVCKDIFESP